MPYRPAIFVPCLDDDHHVLAEDFFAQGCLCGLPKWLAQLGGIYGVEPDFELFFVVIKPSERVAVMNADYPEVEFPLVLKAYGLSARSLSLGWLFRLLVGWGRFRLLNRPLGGMWGRNSR
jgi:hypothetical protein